VIRARPAAGTAVQEHHRLAVRVAAKLPVEAVAVADIQHAGLIWLDLRIERAAFRVHRVHQKLNSS
jgi:hypothetical protein